MKTCSKCNEKKPLSEFAKNTYSRDGLQSTCRKCHRDYYRNNKERKRLISKEYYSNNPTQRQANNIKHKYGIELQQVYDMYDWSGGCCHLCGAPGRLVIDHDHVTGYVRGLICEQCNAQMAWVDRVIHSLRRYIDY